MVLSTTVVVLALLCALVHGRIIDLETEPVEENVQYDYIIIGGGQSGCVLAGRLSEDPAVRVAVLEAGGTGIGNENISAPGLINFAFGTDVDWGFTTEPQKFANNHVVGWPRGRVLGGTTAINGRVFTRGEVEEYDAFERLGNTGWNWDTMLETAKKSENFHVPSDELVNLYGYQFNASSYGTGGPVDVTFSPWESTWIVQGYFPSAELLGRRIIPDGNTGMHDGLDFSPSYVNPDGTRETAFTAYYDDSRDNLVMYVHAHVARISFEESDNGLTALGVEFLYPDNSTGRLSVNREVVLTAGSVQTPQILELSGIGDPAVLGPLGVEVKYANPGVGANVQDHPIASSTWSLKPEFYEETWASYSNATLLAQALDLWRNNGTGILSGSVTRLHYASLTSLLSSEEDLAEAERLLSIKPPGISQAQYDLTKEFVLGGRPVLEWVPIPTHHGPDIPLEGVGYFLIEASVQHPFSRGTIHAKSTDPREAPAIDPHYFESEFDAWILAKGMEFLREIFLQQPFQAVLVNETEPGSSVQTFEDFLDFVKHTVESEYHPIASASMLPEEDGGVVSSEGQVYGTTNVRIADASIIPLHVSAHTTNIVYSASEMIAEKIKRGCNRSYSRWDST